MKVAKEKVWADHKGNLVPDGHADAAVLVAAKGQTVSDQLVEQHKGGDKFFEDAVFDADAKQVVKEDKTSPTPGTTYNMLGEHDAPAPQNREQDLPKLRQRSKKSKSK